VWFFGFDSPVNRSGPDRNGTGLVPTAGVPGTPRRLTLKERLALRLADPTLSLKKPDFEHGRVVRCPKDVIRLFLPPGEDGLTLDELVTRQDGNPGRPDTIAFSLEVGGLTAESKERVRQASPSPMDRDNEPRFQVYKYYYTISDLQRRHELEGEKRGALEAVIKEARGIPPPEGTAWDGYHFSVSYDPFQSPFRYGCLPRLSLDAPEDSRAQR
jgi:hypothetical protein